ncbi:cytosine deaminase [Acidianus sp. RZ1]|uniref:cytosine deaminase n=1 Tax=Acidianus sp. RZ1 TaxID=1540082 RepID=UPI001491C31C|nr:cytosine deaminase [Acidianus sp. RZ1]NON62299.1 amidohydrolase family protein [Acidianus sp. RZ1]
MDLVIRNGLLNGRVNDIAINEGRIIKIGKVIERGEEEIDARGRLVLPPFFNMHFHLDSVFTLTRKNSSGTLWEGIEMWKEIREKITEEDVRTRSIKALKWMAVNGVLYVRTNVDVTEPNLIALKTLLKVKQEVKDFINLQITAFPQDGLSSEENRELLEKAIEMGSDNVGLIPHNEPTREDGIKSIEYAFSIAEKYGKDIDGHVDETDDPESKFLEVIARETIKRGFNGRVTAGHVTAMHSWDPYYRLRILREVAKSGVTVVPNPLINVTLQGRLDPYPKRRGMSPIRMMRDAGINVALGHDCIMDPWYPLGIGDMLQVLFMAVHLDQLTEDLSWVMDLITYNAAKAWRTAYGIEVGKPGDLLILEAKSTTDAIRTMGPPLYVIRKGKIIAKSVREQYVNFGNWEGISFS